jgi:putative transposase
MAWSDWLVVIQTVDVEHSDARPDGGHWKEDEALSERPDRALDGLLPQPATRGRKRMTDIREVVNALCYMVRSGCEWRMLPVHFPPWQTVYWWFRRFVRLLLFRTIHDVVLMIDREWAGREASPTAGVVDRDHQGADGWKAGLWCREEDCRP